MPKNSVIQDIISYGSQDVIYTYIEEIRKKRIKVVIRSDAYRHQCSANSYLWSGEKWELVASMRPSDMRTPASLVYTKDKSMVKWQFINDRDNLIQLSKVIIYGADNAKKQKTETAGSN